MTRFIPKLSILVCCGFLAPLPPAYADVEEFLVVVRNDLGVSDFSELEGATACLSNEIDKLWVAYLASSIHRIILVYAHPPDESYADSTEARLKGRFGTSELSNGQILQKFKDQYCDAFFFPRSQYDSVVGQIDDGHIILSPDPTNPEW